MELRQHPPGPLLGRARARALWPSLSARHVAGRTIDFNAERRCAFRVSPRSRMTPIASPDPSSRAILCSCQQPFRSQLLVRCLRDEIIHVLLGDKWMGVVPIFRLLAPTSLVFALANPLSWLVMATGRVGRAVGITAATTPVVIIGILLGLSHGPTGVAVGYSAAMVLIIIPITAWSKHGTGIAWSDLWNVTRKAACWRGCWRARSVLARKSASAAICLQSWFWSLGVATRLQRLRLRSRCDGSEKNVLGRLD